MVTFKGKTFYDIDEEQLYFIIQNWLVMKNDDIGKKIGLTGKRVSKIGRTIGLPKKKSNTVKTIGVTVGGRYFGKITSEQYEVIVNNPNVTCAELGRRLGIDPRRVSEIQLLAGIRERKVNPIEKTPEFLEDVLDTFLTHKEVAEKYGVTPSCIGQHRRKLGIRFDPSTRTKLPRTPEVDAELKNPYLSHEELARKYNVSASTIARRRKQLGVGVRRKNYNTIPELKMKEILEELDYAYLQQKRIDIWSIDFYMGQKMCIDVYGTWTHNKPEYKEDRDIRKKEYLKENGYKYLIIWEDELENVENVKEKIRSFMAKGFPYQ